MLFHGVCERRFVCVEMLRQQPVAQPRYHVPARVIRGFDGEVALRVQPHRPVVDVRRADPDEAAICNDQFRVHVEVAVPLIRELVQDGMERAEAALPVGVAKPPDQAVAVRAHDELFDPAVALEPDDGDDLRRIGPLQQFDQQVDEAGAREILRLDIDPVARRAQRILVEGGDLVHGFVAVQLRLGPCDSDRCIGRIRHEIRRPDVSPPIGQRQRLPGRLQPALAAQLAERRSGIAVDSHHHVVDGAVQLAARRAAQGLSAGMFPGVPAMPRQVDAADERHRIVDDDDLVMMRAAYRGHCRRAPG